MTNQNSNYDQGYSLGFREGHRDGISMGFPLGMITSGLICLGLLVYGERICDFTMDLINDPKSSRMRTEVQSFEPGLTKRLNSR